MLCLRKVMKGPGNLRLEERPRPALEPDEVLMKVWAAGVCGSDLLIERDRHFYEAPVTLGHEFSGVVEEVGPAVKRVKVGDRITADIETRSGWLGVTRDGGFASHMSVPEAQVHVYPQDVSLDAVCFTEPVVATVHALEERSTVRPGDFVVVVGPGPMGLLGAQFAKHRGARAVAVVGRRGADDRRLEIARAVGADHVLHSGDGLREEVLALSGGRGADLVLDASGAARGLQHALDCARRSPEGKGGNGRIVTISLWGEPITLQADAISLYQLELGGAWSWNGAETWRRAVELIREGVFDFGPLLTGRYRLEDWEQAFEQSRACAECKVFFHPNGTSWVR